MVIPVYLFAEFTTEVGVQAVTSILLQQRIYKRLAKQSRPDAVSQPEMDEGYPAPKRTIALTQFSHSNV
jgi:hypothetical protein